MQKQIKSQGRGGSTGESCEVMLACEGIVLREIMPKQIKSQGRGGSTGSSGEVSCACEVMLACEGMGAKLETLISSFEFISAKLETRGAEFGMTRETRPCQTRNSNIGFRVLCKLNSKPQVPSLEREMKLETPYAEFRV